MRSACRPCLGSSPGQALTAVGIVHKKIRPYRSRTNGKVERFNCTLLDERAYLWPYALGGKPPISRVDNAASQYT